MSTGTPRTEPSTPDTGGRASSEAQDQSSLHLVVDRAVVELAAVACADRETIHRLYLQPRAARQLVAGDGAAWMGNGVEPASVKVGDRSTSPKAWRQPDIPKRAGQRVIRVPSV